MTYVQTALFLGYMVTTMGATAYASRGDPEVFFPVAGVFLIVGYYANIPYISPNIVAVTLLAFSAYVGYEVALKTPEGHGIKTGARDLLFFFVILTFLAKFSISYVEYGTFTGGAAFPVWSQIVNWSGAYQAAQNWLGGQVSFGYPFGGLATIWNTITGLLAYPAGAFIFLGQVVAYIGTSFVDIASFITTPYTLVLSVSPGLASAIEFLIGALMAIAIVFAIRVGASGAHNV